MGNKDFLNQIAEENKKPDSFKEEVRIPVKKEKKPIKPVYIIAPIVALVVIAAVVYFVGFRANIEMPDFVGKTKQDVGQWVTQQGIEATGLIFDEEYNFDYDDGQIISQSIEAGKKVKQNVKINFTISKGADPEEEVTLPDIANMTKAEVQAWAEENKLLKMKITTSFNETVEKDNVISFNVKGCESDSFTRGCTLNVSVSKGPQPAGTITVGKYVDGNVSVVEDWASKNKIELNVVKVFDEKVEAGTVISQSIKEGQTIKQGETLTITVSKGKGVKVPDFSKMANQEIDQWLDKNSAVVEVTKRYNNSAKHVIAQNVGTNGMVSSEDPLKITINLGNTFYLSDVTGSEAVAVGKPYNKLVDFCNDIRYLGIDSYAGQWNENKEVYSEEYSKGMIVSIEVSSYSTGKKYSLTDRLPLDARFSVIISKGKIQNIDLSAAKHNDEEYLLTDLVDILAKNNITFDNQVKINEGSTGSETCIIEMYDEKGQEVDLIKDGKMKFIEGYRIVLKSK